MALNSCAEKNFGLKYEPAGAKKQRCERLPIRGTVRTFLLPAGQGGKVGQTLHCEVRSRPQVEILPTDYILNALGGTAYLARALDIQQSAVTAWRRNGIPANRCLALAEIAVRKRLPHFTVEVLMRSEPRAVLEPPPAGSATKRRKCSGAETC